MRPLPLSRLLFSGESPNPKLVQRFAALNSGFCRKAVVALVGMCLTSPAYAQLTVDVDNAGTADLIIAVPALPSPQNASTLAGTTEDLGNRISDVIASDLDRSGLFKPIGRNAVKRITVDEVTAPTFPYWQGRSASALIQGFVRSNGDGKITVGCYLYDVALGTELTRQGFVVEPADWRRAAHKCADTIYSRLSGESPFFDSRIAYIAETGPRDRRTRRLAIMDQDGENNRFLTDGQFQALTPRWHPNATQIAFMSYQRNEPRVYLFSLESGRQEVLGNFGGMTLSPRFSPDGRSVVLSAIRGGDANIFVVDLASRRERQLTNSPGLDVSPCFSPDGTQIVFNSDRGGDQTGVA